MRWLCLLMFLGCGDDGAVPADAAIDASADATPDAPSGCDYSEQRDGTNDTTETGTAEPTTLDIAQATTLCGSFAADHFDGNITVDVDAFHVQVSAETDLLLRLEANLSTVELAGVDVYSGATFSTLVGTATWYGDHAVTAVHLAPGTYELLPYVLNSVAIPSTISYRVKVERDDPNRCLPIPSGGVVEASDGASSTGNDVYSVPMGAPIALTPSTADAAEPAGTVAPGTPVRLSGTLADVAVADQYEDRDTFSFELPNGTNELSVRVDWQAAANVDFMLFEGTKIMPETRVIRAGTTGPEQLVYPVKAGPTYSIMVAAKPGGTFPVPYSVAMCAARYP